MERYDSTNDTMKHKNLVYSYMLYASRRILKQAETHDNSKFKGIEKEIFDKYTPKLKNTTYGSEEYKQYLKEMQEGLKLHYSENRHHPEHFKNGINNMDLFDIIEMFFDWLAATKRHNDGDIIKSIKINKDRFKYNELMEDILLNTYETINSSFVEEANKIFDKTCNSNTKSIVYDWILGKSVNINEYDKYTEEENKKAQEIIMTLVSNGLG